MNKNIYALSYPRFAELIRAKGITDENVHEHNTAFIQIGGTDLITTDEYKFVLKDNENVLGLRFDDCDEITEHQLIGSDEYVGQYPMNEEQAKQIVNFIDKNKDKASFIVHCRAGQNRSGGITKFLAEIFGMSDLDYRLSNPKCQPNRRIVSMLHKEYALLSEKELHKIDSKLVDIASGISLEAVAEKLRGRELFPESNKRAKEFLESFNKQNEKDRCKVIMYKMIDLIKDKKFEDIKSIFIELLNETPSMIKSALIITNYFKDNPIISKEYNDLTIALKEKLK